MDRDPIFPKLRYCIRTNWGKGLSWRTFCGGNSSAQWITLAVEQPVSELSAHMLERSVILIARTSSTTARKLVISGE